MKNEIKVALTILGAILVGILGYRFMAETPLLGRTYQVYTYYHEVDGLVAGNSVFMQGIKVGSVHSMKFAENDSIEVVLNLNLPDGLPEGSVAHLKTIQIFDKGIELERGPGPDRIEHGGFIRGRLDPGIMGTLSELGEDTGQNIKQSSERLNHTLREIEEMLREGGRRDIEESLVSLRSTLGTIDRLMEEKNTDIEETITSIRNIAENVEGLTSGQEARIDSLVTNLEASSQDLRKMTSEMTDASSELNVILKKINEGEGSLGLMINDPSLYHNLDSLSYNLSRFVKEFNENPRHFLKHVRLVDIF